MAFLQHLVKSLRSGRTVTLPDDETSAFYILMPMVIANQHSSVAQLLNASNFDVNFSCGKSQRSLIQVAANCGATDCLSLLLKKGAKVNAQDVSGCTSLHLAARNGHRNCLSKLLEYNADVNIRNNEGLTMLHWLAVNGRTELLSETLKHITSIDVEDSQGQTALHVACQNGHLSTIVCLVDCGADINRKDHHGSTPLHFACSHGQRDAVKLLLQRKSEFLPDSRGITPLDLSLEGGYCETCETLLLDNPCLFNQIIQNVTRLHVPQSKLHKVFSYLSIHVDSCSDIILSALARLACLTGHELLSPSSDLQFQMNCLLRCMHLIQLLYKQTGPPLCLDVSVGFHDRQRAHFFQLMDDLWNSLEEWLILLKLEIESLNSVNNSCTHKSKDESAHAESLMNPNSCSETLHYSERNGVPASTDVEKTFDNGQMESSGVSKSLSEESQGRGIICEATSKISSDILCTSVPSENPTEVTTGKIEENALNTMVPRIIVIMQSFFICCSCHSPPKTTSPQFVEFVSRHDKVIQFLIEQNPKEIFDHFHFLLDCPELILRFLHVIRSQPFAARRSWFYENLHKLSTGEEEDAAYQSNGADDVLFVNRDNCFHSSCEQILRKTPENLMKHISVRFQGEEGMGQGVMKEWFDVLSKEILNPDYALFTQSADGSTFQPNSNSSVNPDHLNYFRFAGQVMGLALYHHQLLGVYFTRSFYKHILGIPVSYTDVASVDPEYAQNLQWILDHDITDLGLDLTFSVETDVFGMMQEVELKPRGREIAVAEKNKSEYIQLVAQLRMTKAIQPQIDSFLAGFHSFIPRSLIQMFDVDELSLMLSGLREIDVLDWQENTDYNGYDVGDPQVTWFWENVGGLDADGRMQLLQFVTGTSRVPYGGFGSLMGGGGKQKFTIVRCNYSPMVLPSASTCINLLKLPEYPSKEELHEKLLVAIQYGSQGYGLV